MHDAIGVKEEPALTVVKIRADTRLFLFILFLKIEIYIFFS